MSNDHIYFRATDGGEGVSRITVGFRSDEEQEQAFDTIKALAVELGLDHELGQTRSGDNINLNNADLQKLADAYKEKTGEDIFILNSDGQPVSSSPALVEKYQQDQELIAKMETNKVDITRAIAESAKFDGQEGISQADLKQLMADPAFSELVGGPISEISVSNGKGNDYDSLTISTEAGGYRQYYNLEALRNEGVVIDFAGDVPEGTTTLSPSASPAAEQKNEISR